VSTLGISDRTETGTWEKVEEGKSRQSFQMQWECKEKKGKKKFLTVQRKEYS